MSASNLPKRPNRLLWSISNMTEPWGNGSELLTDSLLMKRHFRLVTATACASVALLLFTGAAASPADWNDELSADARPGTLHYVALGDSFTSGEGSPFVDATDRYELAVTTGIADIDAFLASLCDDRLPGADQCRANALTEIEDDYGWLGETRSDGGNGCHRSTHAYPERAWGLLDSRDSGWGVTFAACSGAVTADVSNPSSKGEPPQINAFEAGPADLATVGFGGNDIGFSRLITSCLGETAFDRYAPPGTSALLGDLDQCRIGNSLLVDRAMFELGGRMQRVLAEVTRDEHLKPGAKVMVIGYPRLFPPDPPAGCSTGLGTSLGPDTMRWLNTVVDKLNTTVATAARNADAAFVDTTFILEDAERGYSHGLCTDDGSERWVNRLIPSDRNRSFHPKFQYHERVAAEVVDCWNTCLPTRQD